GRAEMVQQRLLAPRANPRDLVEQRLADMLRALGAVRADGEAVRLVAQALQEVEDRVTRIEAKRCLAGQEEALAPGIAVGPLGDRRDRYIVDAELGEDLQRRRELPGAAIDQHEVGPGAATALGILLEGAGKAPGQHLVHHAVIVAGGERLVRDVPLSR